MKKELLSTELLTRGEVTEEMLASLLNYISKVNRDDLEKVSKNYTASYVSTSIHLLTEGQNPEVAEKIIATYTESLLLAFISCVKACVLLAEEGEKLIELFYYRMVNDLRLILVSRMTDFDDELAKAIKLQIDSAGILRISNEEKLDIKLYISRILVDYYRKIGEILAKYDL